MKESVLIWVPIFSVFVLTHIFVIVYAMIAHASGLESIAAATSHEVHTVSASVGWFGLMALLLKTYSMGAGTYTGIEAVSNGLPILREPRVRTGRRTMVYMGVSLAVTVAGLLVAYQLYDVQINPDKTLNAVLFEKLTAGWGHTAGSGFVIVTLFSEAALLIIAAQTGLPRRPAGPREHGPRPVVPVTVRQPERTPRDPERRPAHGPLGADHDAGDQGIRRPPGDLLLDQRLHHLLALPGRDGPPLVAGARDGGRLEAQAGDQRLRPRADDSRS